MSGGALAGTVLGTNVDRAHACHEDPDVPGYEKSRSVGLMIGFSFGPEVRFVYGIDARATSGQEAAFVRLEGHGISTARLAVGAHLLGDNDLGAEIGLAVQSARRDSDIGGSLGLHLAGGPYDGGGGLQVQGTVPVLGDLRNFHIGAAAVVVPNEVKICMGGGRRLRDGDRTVLPLAATLSDPDGAAQRLWIEDARAEHASVWAFRRLAAELVAASAPSDLAAAALAAARDETRHARLCAAQAGASVVLLPLDDEHLAPRWRAPSTHALATLGREALLDGCLGEGIAAAQAAAAAAGRGLPAALAAQRRIAGDERRHAELAWSILGWVWEQHDAAVRDEIADLVAAVAPPDSHDEDADADLLAHHGRLAAEHARLAAEAETERVLQRARRLVG